jgi:hypothetical protein
MSRHATRIRPLSFVLLTAFAPWVGCAEAGGDPPPPSRDAGPRDLGSEPVDLATPPPDLGGPSPDLGGTDGGSSPGPGALAINEIRATGDDWIELMNTGTTSLDVSGLRVADYDDAAMGPKVAEAVAIPAGTIIPAGGYFVVVADVAAPRAGLQTGCLAGVVPACVEAPYGLSGSRGDRVFVLAAASDTVLLEAEYPGPGAPTTVPDGSTWARLPNGSGAFSVGAPTPAAENAAP